MAQSIPVQWRPWKKGIQEVWTYFSHANKQQAGVWLDAAPPLSRCKVLQMIVSFKVREFSKPGLRKSRCEVFEIVMIVCLESFSHPHVYWTVFWSIRLAILAKTLWSWPSSFVIIHLNLNMNSTKLVLVRFFGGISSHPDTFPVLWFCAFFGQGDHAEISWTPFQPDVTLAVVASVHWKVERLLHANNFYR